MDDTRAFLKDVPEKTQASQNNLMEIIMAQDFQDLTGQVIMKMLGVIGAIETELVQVLIDNVPQEKREETKTLLNGPVVNAAGQERRGHQPGPGRRPAGQSGILTDLGQSLRTVPGRRNPGPHPPWERPPSLRTGPANRRLQAARGKRPQTVPADCPRPSAEPSRPPVGKSMGFSLDNVRWGKV